MDDAQVAARLADLPGWRGDARRLHRTVAATGATRERLLAALAAAERELDHHAEVRQTPDAVTFELWTHSAGAVTELDFRLAERISLAAPDAGA